MMQQKKKILIIGASGFVGSALFKHLQKNFQDIYQVTGTYYSSSAVNNLEKLDITCSSELETLLTKLMPDFILLAAGNKDVRACENNYSLAYTLNTQPVDSLIRIISDNNLPTHLIYISTDYVFDGKTGHYRDTDRPNPSTNYGKTKFLSEQILLQSGIDYKIIRTAALMGKNGIFFDWLIPQLNHEKEVSMWDNVFFSPTPLVFFTEMVAATIENYDQIPQKIIQIVGEKRLNRYQFAIMIKDILHSDVIVHPEKNQDPSTLFQHDLSMVPSDIIIKWRKRDFDAYIRDEVLHAAFCE